MLVAADDGLAHVGFELVHAHDLVDAVVVGPRGGLESLEHALVGERAHAFLWPADHDAGFLGDDVRDADAEVVEALFGVVERGAQQVARVFVAPELQ